MLSLDELRRAALEARDKAKAGEDVRGKVAVQLAVAKLCALIKLVPTARTGLAPEQLPEAVIIRPFEQLGTNDAPFLAKDIETLRKAMPVGFSVDAVKRHPMMCDCGRSEGCTDYVRITWTWE